MIDDGDQLENGRRMADGRTQRDFKENQATETGRDLNNVAQHAGASRVSFEFKRENDSASFRFAGNGIGFVHEHYQSGSLPARNPELITMAERVRVLGGSLDVRSAKGETCISFSIPLQA